MHMKMLHDNPDFAFSYGWTIEGEHYVHCGRIKDNIEVMGHSDDKRTTPFTGHWLDEATRLLSDPDLFKGPRAQRTRRIRKHEPEHSYTTEQVVALLKQAHADLKKSRA